MKLDKMELKALKDMIEQTSKKIILKYKMDNITAPDNVPLFTGDSMIEFFNLEKYFAAYEMINRGVAGATTKTFKKHMRDIVGRLNPSSIYVSIGSNDLVLLNKKPIDVYSNVLDFMIQLRYHFPSIDFHYISMTPVLNEDHKLYKKTYVAGRTNEDILLVNTLLEAHFEKVGIGFINVYDDLVDDSGFLNEAYTADGIHLNDKGYQIYSGIIKKSFGKKIHISYSEEKKYIS